MPMQGARCFAPTQRVVGLETGGQHVRRKEVGIDSFTPRNHHSGLRRDGETHKSGCMLYRLCLLAPALAPGHALTPCKAFPHRRFPLTATISAMSASGQGPEGHHEATAQAPSPSNALSFLRVVGKLKELKRTGWVHRGVDKPESVSDHMYRMAMCSFLITDSKLDRSRIMKLAVVHDLAEALAGDIAPFQKVSREEKRRLEEEGLAEICATIGRDPIALEIMQLWYEYEDCTSEEARVVKDLDKMEMIVQADEYEKGQGLDLSEFFESTNGCFTTPQVQSWDKELREQRTARRQQESTAQGASQTRTPGGTEKENSGGTVQEGTVTP